MKNQTRHPLRIVALIFCIALAIYIVNGLRTPLTVVEYVYQNDKIPEEFSGYTIVQISDLHCENFGNKQSELIEAIAKCEPDLIVLTGDIVDKDHDDISPAIQLLEGIHELAPIYYVTGNHELLPEARTQYHDLLAAFETYGITDLDDSQVTLKEGNASINLYGRRFLSKYLTVNLPIASEKEFDILLYHASDNFDIIAPYHYDLVLSGHMHGGIVRFPLIGGVFGNDGNFFPTFDKGMYTINDATLIASAGLGDARIPRFYNPPELTVIKLQH